MVDFSIFRWLVFLAEVIRRVIAPYEKEGSKDDGRLHFCGLSHPGLPLAVAERKQAAVRELGSDDIENIENIDRWCDLITFISGTVFDLLEKRKAIPPLDVLCTDADDSVVMHYEHRADGTRNFLSGGADTLLDSFRHPLTLTITDKNQKAWELEIPEPKEKAQ